MSEHTNLYNPSGALSSAAGSGALLHNGSVKAWESRTRCEGHGRLDSSLLLQRSLDAEVVSIPALRRSQ